MDVCNKGIYHTITSAGYLGHRKHVTPNCGTSASVGWKIPQNEVFKGYVHGFAATTVLDLSTLLIWKVHSSETSI